MSFQHTLPAFVANLWMALLLFASAGLAQSPPEIGELFASEPTAHGPVLLAGTGMGVISGSQVAAGKSVATLRLARGGEVRLCPSASVAVSAVDPSVLKGNQELMLSMDTGDVELDYPLNDLGDTVITPDFKLMLAGPGVFHFALGVNNRGDTCIRPLRGHNTSIIVSEMLGNGVYQVKQDEALMFVGGKLANRVPLETACGCPTLPPVMEAKKEEEPPSGQAGLIQQQQAKQTESSISDPAPDAAPPPPVKRPDAIHAQVEAPLIFLGDQPEPAYTVAKIRFSALPNVSSPQENEKPIVLKPGKGEVSTKSDEKKGFLGKVKGFFAALFHTNK